jgi:outer membrane immunogenic protein
MIRVIYCTAAAAALAFASPAMAQGNLAPAAPAGFRIEAIVGYDHGGVGAGCDFAVSNSISLGVDAEVSDSTADKDGVSAGHDLYAGARVTFAVSPRTPVREGRLDQRSPQD